MSDEARPAPEFFCAECKMTFQLGVGYEGAKVQCPRCGNPPETQTGARTVKR